MTLDLSFLDRRPIVVALAGSNGAGITTFFHSHIASSGMRFVNADVLAAELGLTAYEAADAAAALRTALLARKESFIFETVLSDPVGDKVDQLRSLVDQGYEVVVIFIQIADPEVPIERVSMRVSQGGHDVLDEKLLTRFERTRANLQHAIEHLPHVIIFDNSDLAHPYRHIATYQEGKAVAGEGRWRSQNPAKGLYAENVAAVNAAIQDYRDGDRGTCAGEHSEQLRRDFGGGSE